MSFPRRMSISLACCTNYVSWDKPKVFLNDPSLFWLQIQNLLHSYHSFQNFKTTNFYYWQPFYCHSKLIISQIHWISNLIFFHWFISSLMTDIHSYIRWQRFMKGSWFIIHKRSTNKRFSFNLKTTTKKFLM